MHAIAWDNNLWDSMSRENKFQMIHNCIGIGAAELSKFDAMRKIVNYQIQAIVLKQYTAKGVNEIE